jgi:hypothetical protein
MKHWKNITLAYFQRWNFEYQYLRIALMPQRSVAAEYAIVNQTHQWKGPKSRSLQPMLRTSKGKSGGYYLAA